MKISFSPLEEKIHKKFLPAMFGEPSLDDNRRSLATLPVKHAGLALPDPTVTAESNYKDSTLVCGHLVQALSLNSDVIFSPVDHSSTRKEVTAAMRARKTKENSAKLESMLSKLDAATAWAH